MADTPPDPDNGQSIPPTTTFSIAMTATAPSVPVFEAVQAALDTDDVQGPIDLHGSPVNVWQPATEPIEAVAGLFVTPP